VHLALTPAEGHRQVVGAAWDAVLQPSFEGLGFGGSRGLGHRHPVGAAWDAVLHPSLGGLGLWLRPPRQISAIPPETRLYKGHIYLLRGTCPKGALGRVHDTRGSGAAAATFLPLTHRLADTTVLQ
jgi:hypothetical protein